MFGKSEAFDLYLTELIDEKLRNLSETDGKYVKAKAKEMFEIELFESGFNCEDFKMIEDFYDLLCDVSYIENQYLYLEGFMDGMRLLTQL